MAGRPENTIESDKVHASLPEPAIRCLELLLKSGRYGTNLSDVARYVLLRGIDDLTRAHILPPQEICEPAKQIGQEQCATYRFPLFLAIQVGEFLDLHNGLIIAIFTGSLWWSTYKLWTAGERQLRHSEDSSHAELRAYLDFDGVKFLRDKDLDTSEEVGTGISIRLKNYGKTPAHKIKMETTYLVHSKHMKDAHKVAFDTDKQFSYIMPSDHATSHGRFMMPRMIWEAINEKIAQVRVAAKVGFVDYLGEPHSIECVFESNGILEKFGFVAGTRKAD